MKLNAITIIFICVLSAFVFADGGEHSVEFSGLLYRFSYSEEFDYIPPYQNINGVPWRIIGRPRSDEYGATVGFGINYSYLSPKNNITFGMKFNYARSARHVYDGSFQAEKGTFIDSAGNRFSTLLYEPHKDENKDNFFYKGEIKIGYLIDKKSGRVKVEPKILWTMNGWKRPVGYLEKYYWSHISPAIYLVTKNSENLGIFSQIGLLIPIWEQMIIPHTSGKYKFEIGGKLGWNFDFGFAKYLKYNRTIKIAYFYENYGFKESPQIEFADGRVVLEPSSSTHNHGVKILFEKRFTVERN